MKVPPRRGGSGRFTGRVTPRMPAKRRARPRLGALTKGTRKDPYATRAAAGEHLAAPQPPHRRRTVSRPRIVIVGAGFAGYRTARTLARLTRHKADITLLNPTD